MLISKMKQEYLADHNSHPSPLLSRSCRTECAVWHSCTSRTPLLWDLWWTRLLPSGRPMSPKQTAINHSDSTINKRRQSWSPLGSHRNWWQTTSSSQTQSSYLFNVTHVAHDDLQDLCGQLTAAQIWQWQRSWPWWCHPTSDLQEDEQVVFHSS